MAIEEKDGQAQKVFDGLCGFFDQEGWKYKKLEDMSAETLVMGDGLDMKFNFFVLDEAKLLLVHSTLPFSVPNEQRGAMAVAVCYVNSKICAGCFVYDFTEGRIYFRVTASFRESSLGNEAYSYLNDISCQTVDQFNDLLYDVARGRVSVDELIEQDDN